MLTRILRWPSLFVLVAALGASVVVGWWRYPVLALRIGYVSGVLAAVMALLCLLVIAGRKRRKDERLPLWLFAGGILAFAVGQLVGTGLPLFDLARFPAWVTALLFVLGHLSLGAGLLFGGGLYPRTWSGIAAVAGDVALTVLVLVIIVVERGVHAALAGGLHGAGLLTWGYAVGVLAALGCLVVSMSATTPNYQHGPRRLLLVGVGLALGGDAAMKAFGLIETVGTFPFPLLLWSVGYPLVGLAVLWEHAARPKDAQEARDPDAFLNGASMVVPAILIAAESVILLVEARGELHAPVALLLYRLVVVLALLVLARFLIGVAHSRLAYLALLQRVKESERLSVTDTLTGLANKRACTQRLEDELARARRYQRPFAVLFCDIDFFKLINDVHGHHIGDRALIEVGKFLRESIRTTDLVARLGGEEFLLILPETTVTQAGILAERLRAGVEKLRLLAPGGTPLKLTISLGIAGYPETSESVDDLLRDSDEAMHHAKESGRNRVMTAKAKVSLFKVE